MNLPVIVDVGIGLIIIYISAALIVSGVQEAIAALFQWRSQHLKESILQIMLGQEVNAEEFTKAENMRNKIYQNSLIQSMNYTSVSWVNQAWNLGKSLILVLLSSLNTLPSKLKSFFSKEEKKDNEGSNNNSDQSKKYQQLYSRTLPSYIDNKSFATALIYELKFKGLLENPPSAKDTQERKTELENIKEGIRSNAQIPNSLRDSLIALVYRAQVKVKEGENFILSFQKEIEDWFDSSMARASGVYKRNTQLVGLILALIVVIFFNLDSVNIAQKLFNDSTLRSLLVDGASTLVASSKIDPTDPNSQLDSQKLEESINQLFGNSLPIVPIYENASNFMNCPAQNNCPLFSHPKNFSSQKFVLAFIGWAITTLAIYMGAPFWFELLSKFVNIRSTGSRTKSEQ